MHKELWRDKAIPLVSGVVVVTLCYMLLVFPPQFIYPTLQRLDGLIYDLQLKALRLTNHPLNSNIIIVDVDEKSLRAEGRWPWPRDKIAHLLKNLQDNGAVVTAFDMTFTKPEQNIIDIVLNALPGSATPMHRELLALHKKFDTDHIFAQALAKNDVVLGYVFDNNLMTPEGMIPAPIYTPSQRVNKDFLINTMSNARGNLPILQQAAKYGGFITTLPDDDGIVRRTPLIMRYHNQVYPSLALQASLLYLLIDKINLDISQIGKQYAIESIDLNKIKIPTDARGQVLIPFVGPRFSFRYFSATDVLNNHVDKSKIKNSLIFIGTSALGLGDAKATPVSNLFPGVEIHATVAQGILDQRFPYRPVWAQGIELATILIFGFIFALSFPFIGAWALIVISTSFIVSLLVGSAWIFQVYDLSLSPLVILLMTLALATINMSYGFAFEKKRRQQLKDMFGQYVPPARVEEMSRTAHLYNLGGESKNITTLFADIRNFSGISENLSASEVQRVLNMFFTPMTEIIFAHHGTIDKYVGDMLMAFWNAPMADPHHQKNAISAAILMQKKSTELIDEFKRQGLPEVNIGIGINTGETIVGDMGSQFRRAYTVIGDAVNIASRLQDLTKYYGINIIVSETTIKDQHAFVFRQLDRVKLKGKQIATDLYQPIGFKPEVDEATLAMLNHHQIALNAYFQQQWTSAASHFQQLLPTNPTLYQLYLNRILEFKKNPPPQSWDGSFTRETE